MKINLTLLEIILLFVICLLSSLWARDGKRIKKWWEERRKRRRGPRQLRPRQPADCPECARGIHWLPRWLWPEVVPWSEVKSPQGRKKTIDTSGYACLNIWCRYFGIADATVHTLVSDGWRGKNKDILYLRLPCQSAQQIDLCKTNSLCNGVPEEENEPGGNAHVPHQDPAASGGDGHDGSVRRGGPLRRQPDL